MASFSQEPSTNVNGLFITFEGGEGAGKTTHIRFLADALRSQGRDVLCLREPGGTDIGEELRRILLSPSNDAMVNETELYLYEAARAQLVSQVIRPALDKGTVVLCDRFTDSTLAYQAYGRGLDRDFVESANEFACQGLHPDRTILLKTGGSVHTGLVRATHRSGADRLERAGENFHERVNKGFDELALAYPDRIRVVVSADKKSQTARAIFDELSDIFPWMSDETCCSPKFFERLDVQRSSMGHVFLTEEEQA
jgi:dTMP kinase